MLAEKKQELLAAGCEFVMLSGSGSALMGISSSGSLQEAKVKLAESADVDVILCRTLSRDRYVASLKDAGLQIDQC
jgi:hypothetical protein